MPLTVGDEVETEVAGRPVTGEIVNIEHSAYIVDTGTGQLEIPADSL
jgi:hypothetical protein